MQKLISNNFPVRIAILENGSISGTILKPVINGTPDFKLVAQDKSGDNILEIIKKYRPDVILIDLILYGSNGIEVTARLKEFYPDIKIIILSDRTMPNEVLASFGSGASAYCRKNINPDELKNVIRTVYKGAFWVDPAVAKIAQNFFPKPKNTSNVIKINYDAQRFKLSSRELDVLGLVAEGKSNIEIGKALFISEHTAKAHVCSILQKMEAKDRVQAAVLAVKMNLV